MKTATVNFNLYELHELDEQAREKAIEEHRRFMLEIMRPDDFISGDPEYDTPEELQKTYEAEYDYILMNDDPVIESIEINEYLFFEDGELANVCSYYGGLRAGETWLKVHGKEYKIA
jgi:hypothetical protein